LSRILLKHGPKASERETPEPSTIITIMHDVCDW
jgi:hypothetical protein